MNFDQFYKNLLADDFFFKEPYQNHFDKKNKNIIL